MFKKAENIASENAADAVKNTANKAYNQVIHTGNECKDSVKSTAAEVDEKN